jgi:hypothetical protein
MIIGISGRMGSGKDTIGTIIQGLLLTNKNQSSEIKKFAGKLKQIASILTGIPVEMFEDQEFKKTFLSREWDTIVLKPGKRQDGLFGKGESEIKQTTVRELLQKLGTDAMRDNLHENVWCNALFADYKDIIEERASDDLVWVNKPNWIITDLRFPNELKAVKDRDGITIRVVRPGTINGDHPSETALDDAAFDYEIINDGTIEDLIKKVKKVLLKEKLI